MICVSIKEQLAHLTGRLFPSLLGIPQFLVALARSLHKAAK
jgi:hypothetical protein